MTVHVDRLHSEYAAMKKWNSNVVSWRTVGNSNPPDKYELTFNLKSIIGFDISKKPIYHTGFMVEVVFPTDYPRTRPNVFFSSNGTPYPIHPNIWTDGRIWIEGVQIWIPGIGISIDSICQMVGEIIAFQEINMKNPVNSDKTLLDWIKKNLLFENEMTNKIQNPIDNSIVRLPDIEDTIEWGHVSNRLIKNLIIVVEHTGKQIPVEQCDSRITAEELLRNLADKINMPMGTRGVLSRGLTHRQILSSQTLENAGIADGEILIADFERTAGGGVVISSYKDIQIIDTYFKRNQVLSYSSFALSAIILYTAADKSLGQFIRENFLELHHLAGHRFIFYIIERPNPEWIPLMRKELGDELGPHIERVWNLLDKGEFSPIDGSTIYEIVNKFGIKRNQLPCICFFTNLQNKDLLVLPLSSLLDKSIDLASHQEFLDLFRDLFDKVDMMANYPENDRLQQIQREIAKIRNGKAFSVIEKILLPEAIGSTIGAIVKLLIR